MGKVEVRKETLKEYESYYMSLSESEREGKITPEVAKSYPSFVIRDKVAEIAKKRAGTEGRSEDDIFFDYTTVAFSGRNPFSDEDMEALNLNRTDIESLLKLI